MSFYLFVPPPIFREVPIRDFAPGMSDGNDVDYDDDDGEDDNGDDIPCISPVHFYYFPWNSGLLFFVFPLYFFILIDFDQI